MLSVSVPAPSRPNNRLLTDIQLPAAHIGRPDKSLGVSVIRQMPKLHIVPEQPQLLASLVPMPAVNHRTLPYRDGLVQPVGDNIGFQPLKLSRRHRREQIRQIVHGQVRQKGVSVSITILDNHL